MRSKHPAARAVFVHHSVGRYMIQHGDMRKALRAIDVGLWDTDYNKFGAHNELGVQVPAPEVPDDNTDPDGLLRIFTQGSENDKRFIAWLQDFDVVALKSCYPASNIASDADLVARKELYRALSQAVSRALPAAVLLTPPPLAPLRTNAANAARACDLASSLTNQLKLPLNVTVFDLHGLLARIDAGGDGTLARPYRRWLPVDSHPNSVGARVAGSKLAEHLLGRIRA